MNELVAVAQRYARLRWVGIALFWISGLLFLMTFASVLLGWQPIGRLMGGVLCMGLSLGSFGTSCDTTLWALRELSAQKSLPPEFVEEWRLENERRPERIVGYHSSPKAALLLPFLAIGAQTLVCWRLWTSWSAS